MQINYVQILSFVLSVLTTAVTVGVSIGILRANITTLKNDLNCMGARFDRELDAIKSEYIAGMTIRIREGELGLKELAVNFGRMEERIIGLQQNIVDKIDIISAKLGQLK